MTQSIKLRAVVEGDDMVVAVEGGYIRRPAPADGVVVSTDVEELFLPEAKLVEALTALNKARSDAQPAMRPKRAAQMELPEAAPRSKKQNSGS